MTAHCRCGFVVLQAAGWQALASLCSAVWEALRAESSLGAAMDKAFAGVDWDKFEDDFWSYVGQMSQPKK